MEELRERLRREIRRWGSVRGLARTLKEREPRPTGSSRQMIQRYLSGDGPEPPLEFLRAAADVLGVRVEYLAHGEGPKTDAEEQRWNVAATTLEGLIEDIEEAKENQQERLQEARDELAHAFRAPISPLGLSVFLHVWSRMKAKPGIQMKGGDRSDLTRQKFAGALAAAFAAVEDRVGRPDSREVEEYIVEAAPDIGRALQERWEKSLTSTQRLERKEGTDG